MTGEVTATFTQNGSVTTLPVGTLSLAPAATRTLDFSTLLSSPAAKPDRGTIQLTESFSGNEGDIQLEAGSVDQSGNYVFEAESHMEDWTISRTICYWTVFSDTNTMISLWNYTSATQDLLLTLFYKGGKYELPVHLNGGADLDVDVASVIRRQVPDAHGVVLPSNVTEGSAILSSSQGEREKIFVASSTSTFNVRNGTCTNQCGTCNGVISVAFNPASISLKVGAQMQAGGLLTYNTGETYPMGGGARWSTGSPVATVTTSGLVTGQSVGSTQTTFGLDGVLAGPGYICMGNSLTCPVLSFGASGPTSVPPTLSLSTPLWFFGLGNTPPSQFTLGNIQTVVTAGGASGGSFVWNITAGTSTPSFSSSSPNSSVSTSSNSVTIYSIGAGSTNTDVTVTLKWTPPGSNALTSQLSLGVDSPYSFTSIGPPYDVGLSRNSASCGNALSGTDGYETYIAYYVYSKINHTRITNQYVGESFSSQQDQTTNNWPPFVALDEKMVSGGNYDQTALDAVCIYNQPPTYLFNPAPLNPQPTLTSTQIDSAYQAWFIGSPVAGGGAPEVQSDTLQRYKDHARHLNVHSPLPWPDRGPSIQEDHED